MHAGTARALLIGAALLLSVPAGAQPAVEFQWTPEVDRGVYGRMTRERVRTAPPAGFSVSVGAEVPAGVELYEAPADLEYAPVRRYRYTVHEDRVFIVDPSTRRVVRIINR